MTVFMTKASWYLFFLTTTIYLLCANGAPWPEAANQMEVAREVNINHRLGVSNPLDPCCQFRGPDGLNYDIHSIGNVLLMLPIAWLEPELVSFYHERTITVLNFLASFLASSKFLASAASCTLSVNLAMLFT